MNGKLSLKSKLGYGSASLGDSACYLIINTYLLFFLTSVVGISPGAAGTITITGALWNALTGPVFGYISDNFTSKHGRRRPFIYAAAAPMAILIVLLFTSIEAPYTFRLVYYTVMLILFWTAYVVFFIPYCALGTEYTDDYSERTELRSYASIFNMLGNVVGMVIPPLLVALFTTLAVSLSTSWTMTAASVGLIAAVSILVTAKSSKGRDVCMEKEEKAPAFNLLTILKEYVQLLSLRPMRCLLLTSLFALTCNGILVSDFIYFLTYNLGSEQLEISAILTLRIGICILLILIVKKVCINSDKKLTMMGVYIISIPFLIILRFTDVSGLGTMVFFVTTVALSTSIYWQIMPSMLYDACEYDRLMTGRSRQGTIVSFQSLVESLAFGIGSQLLGIILQISGFDGTRAVQTAEALTGIKNCLSIFPAIFIVLALIALSRYPLTKKRLLEIRNEHEDHV